MISIKAPSRGAGLGPPTSSLQPEAPRCVFRLARYSIKSRSSVFLSFAATSAGIAEGPRLRSSIASFGTVDELPFGGDQPHLLCIFAAKNAGVDLAVAGGEHHRLKPLGDLLVGIEDRLEQVGPGQAGTDAGKLWAHFAAGRFAACAFDFVAANALDVRPGN